jgi:hypothetical protein
MNTETAAKIRESAIGALVILLTVMLAVGGLNSVTGAQAAAAPEGDSSYRCDHPPLPTEPQQSMAPDGRPFRAASEHLILPLIVKTDNTGKRLPLDARARLDRRVKVFVTSTNASLRTSTSQVAPHLGRQFTLVGARPSGTG